VPALWVEGGRDPGGVRDLQPRDDRRACARAAKPEAATGTKPARGPNDHGTDPRRPERARREVRTMMVQVRIQKLTAAGDKDGDVESAWAEVLTAPNVGDRWPSPPGYLPGIVRERQWALSIAGWHELAITVEARRKPEATP
jgi:hypothetical protein